MKNNRGRSFVMIMVVVAVCTLLMRIGIERLIKINIVQNESAASKTLKLISTALENYAKDKQGRYPEDFSLLIKAVPAYLDKDYLSLDSLKGYVYACPRFEPGGYTCYATPLKCRLSGNRIYTISTGALLVAEECKRKE